MDKVKRIMHDQNEFNKEIESKKRTKQKFEN
jgi:hypothetical protein